MKHMGNGQVVIVYRLWFLHAQLAWLLQRTSRKGSAQSIGCAGRAYLEQSPEHLLLPFSDHLFQSGDKQGHRHVHYTPG